MAALVTDHGTGLKGGVGNAAAGFDYDGCGPGRRELQTS